MIGDKDVTKLIREGEITYGYKEVMRMIKNGRGKLVVMANNIPENRKKEIEHNAKISGIKIEVFDGSSRKLGLLCGKPYPISVLVVE